MDFSGHGDETGAMGLADEGLLWHPLLVHIPLVLALVMALVTLFLMLVERRQLVSREVWGLAPSLALCFAVSTVFARIVANDDYRRIAPLISDDALEAMDMFLLSYDRLFVLGCMFLVFAVVVWWWIHRFAWLRALFFVCLAGLVLFVLDMARLGGELIYLHRVIEVGL